uniref:Pseudouridine synthase I TruA alpha/beta domain-containing protein n=1 Tax=Meloidogyne incognita TaxID=6306 RepID=A0A914LLA5_MELIC
MIKRFIRSFLEMLNNTSIESTNALRKRSAEETANSVINGPTSPKIQRKPKKVKYAMLLAYQGQNYFGMQFQRNPKFPTIENHLFNAMEAHGFITKEHYVNLMDWHFQRAARTDRSVSAVGQVCSMHLPMDQNFIDNGPALLNTSLPEDIHVFAVRRVTPSFHAQKSCDSRTYSYTLPTFSFASMDEHQLRFRWKWKGHFATECRMPQRRCLFCGRNQHHSALCDRQFNNNNKVTSDEYRISPKRIEELNELLGCYVGSHNFFNYTSGLEFSDQTARRVILSITAEEPFLYTDPIRLKPVEFLRIKIRGQSFILHQIRKMIGTVLAIMRGFMYKSDVARSFLSVRMDIPKAPGLGLLLERLHYDRYEKRFEKTHGSLNNWGEEIETQLLEWRDKMIMDRILSEECRTQSMMRWLTTLPAHNYITDPEDETGDKSINKDLCAAAKNTYTAAVGSDPSNIADNEGDELDNNDDLETEPSQIDEENEKNFENKTEGEEKIDRSRKSVAI